MFTAHNAFLLKTMALAGRGVAWLPESLVADELRTRQLVPAGGDAWRVPIEVRLYRQNAEMTPTAEALWRVVGGDAGVAAPRRKRSPPHLPASGADPRRALRSARAGLGQK